MQTIYQENSDNVKMGNKLILISHIWEQAALSKQKQDTFLVPQFLVEAEPTVAANKAHTRGCKPIYLSP